MKTGRLLCATMVGLLAWIVAAAAQQEFPPPQGKGRVVVVASGQSGPGHYTAVTQQIAQLGYDAVLFDSNPMEGTRGAALRAAIQQAQQMPHALPGKVVLIGFSLGGAISLGFGTMMGNEVAGAILWYPATSEIRDIPGLVSRVRVPVLMFAGEQDSYRGCCLIGTARTIASTAAAAGKPFELVTYPNARHDFVYGGDNYDAQVYQDAMRRTAAKLKEFFAN